MSLHKKKLSLLIPKHKNKTAIEIAQMYMSSSSSMKSTPKASLTDTPKSDANSMSKKILIPPNPKPSRLKPPTKVQFEQKIPITKVKNPHSIKTDIKNLLQYIEKSREIYNSYTPTEEKLISAISSNIKKTSAAIPSKSSQKHETILSNFKQSAIEADKKIADLLEENKLLKEKLARATLEEVDFRLRNENPVNRLIEKYTTKEIPSSPITTFIDQLTPSSFTDYISNPASFTSKLNDLFSITLVQNYSNLISVLCNSISQSSKLSKKSLSAFSKLLCLKRSITQSLSSSLCLLSPSSNAKFES
jgi:hypothetical protein